MAEKMFASEILTFVFYISLILLEKSTRSTVWQFDKTKGIFVTRQPKNADPNAIEMIDINDDCYIEIFCNHNVYTYTITETDFDDFLIYTIGHLQ